MIIDFHTHFFPDRIARKTIDVLSDVSQIDPCTDGTARALSQSMERAGVDLSVNLPVLTRPEQAERVNDSLQEEMDDLRSNGILTFAGMHPGYADYRQKLRSLAHAGFKGIKLHPAYQRTDLDDPAMMKIIDAACECGLTVLVHAGLDIGIPGHNYADVPMILRVLDEVRPDRLVLAHMGGWKDWERVESDLAGANVWLDTAFSLGRIGRTSQNGSSCPQSTDLWQRYEATEDPSGFEHGMLPTPADWYNLPQDSFVSLCRRHGTDKILFGTDCPWADQKQYVDAFCSLALTQEEQTAILGGNAMKLLGL